MADSEIKFQQDNALIPMATMVKEWLKNSKVLRQLFGSPQILTQVLAKRSEYRRSNN